MKDLYFAYGSNMDPERLLTPDRAPSARFLCLARLDDYYLAFAKPADDGSGKAGIRPRHDTAVWGVVFELDPIDWHTLDQAVGEGKEYERVDIRVKSLGGALDVHTYLPLRWDSSERLFPRSGYLDHLLKGANYYGLPPEYVAMLEMEYTL